MISIKFFLQIELYVINFNTYMGFNHYNLKLKNLYLLVCIITLSRCSNINGKIEVREKIAFLVNSSPDKLIQFTIKKTQKKNDSIFNYTTQLIKLAPGDEKLLGYTDLKSEVNYPLLTRQIYKFYEFNKRNVTYRDFDDNDVLTAMGLGYSAKNFFLNLPDTLINEKKMKYILSTEQYFDSLHALPQHSLKNIFQVTGQLIIKQK